MKEIPYFTYYALLLLSAMGLVQSAYVLFFMDKSAEHKNTSPFNRPDAPSGHRWVLMTEEEAASHETSHKTP